MYSLKLLFIIIKICLKYVYILFIYILYNLNIFIRKSFKIFFYNGLVCIIIIYV